MIEIWVSETKKLELRVYNGSTLTNADSPPTVVVKKDGTQVATGTATAVSTGLYTYDFPSALINSPATYIVTWSFAVSATSLTRKEVVEVVVPYCDIDDITVECPSLASKSLDELVAMERRVRKIIDVYTGQSFGYELDKAYKFTGTGDDILYMDRRLWDVTSVVNENGVVLLAGHEGTVWAYDWAGSDVLWRHEGLGALRAAPAPGVGIVAIGDLGGRLYVLDRATGERLWHAKLNDAVTAPALVSGERVYAITEKGRLYAFHPTGSGARDSN